MPKIEKTEDGGWKYNCTCGMEMVLYVDPGKKPKKLIKCFECQDELEDIYNEKKSNNKKPAWRK